MEGERHYDTLEKQLAAGPVITVLTIMLEGDANGAPHPDSSAYANKFGGPVSIIASATVGYSAVVRL